MNPGQLRKLVAKWPGVTEDIKWGADLVFSVGGKMFAVTGTDPKQSGGISFKVPDERFLELTDRKGIVPAPYLARLHAEKDGAGITTGSLPDAPAAAAASSDQNAATDTSAVVRERK